MIFDYSARTFRNDLFDDYKAHRPDVPEDLVPQFPLIRDAVKAFNVACIEQEGYEADDLIATYARQALEAGADVTIVSSDKDLMQLVRPGVRMYDTMKNKVIGEDEVMERFGVPPSKVIEVQALIGDSTDNVPGVPGIGVKTAALLINEYGDLDTLLARASEITQPKRRESLITFADQARLSRTLVILDTNVPLEVPLAETLVRQPDAETLTSFMRKLEFSTLLRRVAEGLGRRAAGRRGAARQATSASASPPTTIRCARCRRSGSSRQRTEPVDRRRQARPVHLAEERAAKLARSALRPQQIRDGDPSGAARRAARRGARAGPCRLPRQAHVVRPDAGRAGRRGACASSRTRRSMSRSAIARATGSISAARARSSR